MLALPLFPQPEKCMVHQLNIAGGGTTGASRSDAITVGICWVDHTQNIKYEINGPEWISP
jgi:hypothetical protein